MKEEHRSMTQIILTSEQAAAIASATGLVALRLPDGTFIGWISPHTKFIIPNDYPFTPEEIAIAESEADLGGPWHTTREVMQHLRSLDTGHQ